MKMQLTNVFRKADNIVTRKVMEETLLVPISGELALMDELYTLNDTGAYIWQALDGERSLAEIGRQLEQEYEVSGEVVEEDMLDIIKGLSDAGLIVSAP